MFYLNIGHGKFQVNLLKLYNMYNFDQPTDGKYFSNIFSEKCRHPWTGDEYYSRMEQRDLCISYTSHLALSVNYYDCFYGTV